MPSKDVNILILEIYRLQYLSQNISVAPGLFANNFATDTKSGFTCCEYVPRSAVP